MTRGRPSLTQSMMTSARRREPQTLSVPSTTPQPSMFANVFEYIPPDERDSSLQEMFRILNPGGVVRRPTPNS